MSYPKGANLGGIRTIEDLRLRCRIDEDTDCWHYGKASRSHHAPGVRLAVLGQEMVSLGVAIAVLSTGKRPEKGVCWHVTCTTPQCANPDHRKAGTRRSQMRSANYKPAAQTLAKIASTKRSKSALSKDAIEAIRSSDETLAVLSERHGVSPSHISRIRLGQCWSETAAPAASVFSWRPAA